MTIINSDMVRTEGDKLIINNKAEVNKMDTVGGLSGLEVFNSKRRVAETSIISNRELVESGKKQRQNDIMFDIIAQHQPITRRMAWQISGFEQQSAGRGIAELYKSGKIKVAYNDRCVSTGKLVGFYTLPDWQMEESNDTKEVVHNVQ